MKGQARQYGGQEHQGRRQKFASGPRSRLASAIARLAEGLDLDLLEAALGVPAPALQEILYGRGKEQELRYEAHILYQLEAAYIPNSWINDPSARLTAANQFAIKELAAQSSKKSGIRRHNFKMLVKAFEGRLNVVADALEILEPSIAEIATGVLPFDDHRFGHINPRMVAAGVIDGWLEQPDAEVSPDIIEKLEAQAAEDYEQSYLEEDSVSEPSQGTSTTAATAVTTIAPAEAAVATAEENVSHQSGANAQEVSLSDDVTIEKEIEMKTPRGAKAAVSPSTTSQLEFKAAGIPGLAGATLPMQPKAEGVKPAIPRGAMASGRTLGKSLSSAPSAGSNTATLQKSAQAPASKQAPAAAPATAASSADSEIREISMRRADALEKLLESARRGAKVTLWRDILKSSLGYWGNIRRSQVFLRDPLANDITNALGLPHGWLDNPVFPPPTIADWVMNPDVPLPGKAAEASTVSAAKAKSPKVVPKAVSKEASLRAPVPSPAPATLSAVAESPAIPQAEPTPAPAQQAAPVVQSVGVDWQPATAAQPVEKLGPIVTALVRVIQDLGLQGKLTEQEALKLLNGFMTKS